MEWKKTDMKSQFCDLSQTKRCETSKTGCFRFALFDQQSVQLNITHRGFELHWKALSRPSASLPPHIHDKGGPIGEEATATRSRCSKTRDTHLDYSSCPRSQTTTAPSQRTAQTARSDPRGKGRKPQKKMNRPSSSFL